MSLNAEGRHPGVQQIARFFDSEHLPGELAAVSVQCADLAQAMINDLPDDPELTFGLRQLLLAKDAFVRVRAAQLKETGS